MVNSSPSRRVYDAADTPALGRGVAQLRLVGADATGGAVFGIAVAQLEGETVSEIADTSWIGTGLVSSFPTTIRSHS